MRHRPTGAGLFALLSAALLACAACKDKPKALDPDLGDLDERNVARALARHRGQVVLLNFWAVWCEPCAKEMPDLVSLARDLGPKGLVLVTVNMTGEDSRAGARRFLDRFGVKPPRYQYAGKSLKKFTRALGVSWTGGLPATYLFDKKGQLRWSHLGPVTRSMLSRKITPLL